MSLDGSGMKSTSQNHSVCCNCVACGATSWEPFLSGPDQTGAVRGVFNYVRCSQCGVIRMEPLPDEQALALLYPADYTCHRIGRERIARRVQSWLRRKDVQRLARYISGARTALEIGCGVGEFLDTLSRSGWSVVGLEPNPSAVESGRKTFGLDIRHGTLRPGLFEPAQFECVLLRQVLEHVPRPSELLTEIRRILRPGGLLFVSTPNHDSLDRFLFRGCWHGYEVPRHIFIYSTMNLSTLLRRHEFEILTVRHNPVPNNYAWSMRYFCQKQQLLRWSAGFFRPTNPLTWPIFLPIALLGAWIRRSGRIEILARRGA